MLPSTQSFSFSVIFMIVFYNTKVVITCIKVEKPPDVTFDTITPDSLRSEKGLLKV